MGILNSFLNYFGRTNMVDPLQENNPNNDSLGMEGVDVQLEDYDDVKHPKAIGSEDQGQSAASG